MENKIKDCMIVEGKYVNTVYVIYDDNSTDRIGCYYPDELHYNEKEFIGLTGEQARRLMKDRDIYYLRG